MSRVNITFRPIVAWPGSRRLAYRSSPFQSSHDATLRLLRFELEAIKAANVVVQVALDERDITRDGLPRADRTPRQPGVILCFEKPGKPRPIAVQIPCDTFPRWTDNLRAIALGLEALRRVDRYGITQSGEQYRGWAALPGPIVTPPAMSVDEAVTFIAANLPPSWVSREPMISSSAEFEAAYKAVAKRLHPDTNAGQELQDWHTLQKAAEVLKAHHQNGGK